jgi:hypothetical protein
MLHASMAVIRVMLNKLCQDGDDNPALAAALAKVLEEVCKIKLAPEKRKKKDKARTFSERIAKSRLQRPEFLNIVENQEALLEAFRKHSTVSDEEKDQVLILFSLAFFCSHT